MGSRYNKIERLIAVSFGKLPFIKRIAKYLYSRINFILFRKRKIFESDYCLKSFASTQSHETFFGYYDKSPLNNSGDIILYHESPLFTSNLPSSKVPINVVARSFHDDTLRLSLSTSSYNWQQGSKLQWIDNDKFIFNDFDHQSENYCSYIVNARTNHIENRIDFPIYDVHTDFGYTLNYDRLAELRPDYGYRNRKDLGIKIDLNNLNNDGIFYCDLKSNSCHLIISLRRLAELNLTDISPKAIHKVNHIMISPEGSHFVFLHRYFVRGRKFDRLILSDKLGNNLKVLADHEMVSHYFWYSNNEIIAFMRDFELGDKYYLINIITAIYEPLGLGITDRFGDGHPNFKNDKLLFDTYPNRSRMKELFLYETEKRRLEKIGEFYESFKYYGQTRCDLHPRWSNDGKWIFFDSLHTGSRCLYGINLCEK
jgi:hypothetical protein